MKIRVAYFFILFILVFSCLSGLYGIDDKNLNSKIRLEFIVNLDKEVYDMSDFGEPPQIAVWVVLPGDKWIKTIGVTRRTAKDIWKGKVECLTSLPLWKSRIADPEKNVDSYSCATPKNGVFKISSYINNAKEIECFLEINVSGDFNHAFPFRDSRGMPDPEVNGQPSLLYFGKLKCSQGSEIDLKLIGRSDQWKEVDKVIYDLKGITSAKKLVKSAWVRCFK